MGDRRVPRAEDRLAPDRRLDLREWGARPARPLFFWPGLNTSAHAQLDEAGPVWAERYGFRVLAAHPPGWGTPPLEPDDYRPSALARRILPTLDELEVERVAYVGYSWGASIGCHLAALAPERLAALVLLDAGYTDFQDQPDFVEKTLEEMTEELRAQDFRFDSWDAFVEAARKRHARWRPPLEARARAGMREVNGEIVPLVAPEVVAAAAHGVAVEPPSATLPALARVQDRILLVTASGTVETEWGRRALERFRVAVPGAEVRRVDSGHDVLADAYDDTISIVGEWLSARVRLY